MVEDAASIENGAEREAGVSAALTPAEEAPPAVEGAGEAVPLIAAEDDCDTGSVRVGREADVL